MVPRSLLLRLLRRGCNASEIAHTYGLDEPTTARRLYALQRTVRRRSRLMFDAQQRRFVPVS